LAVFASLVLVFSVTGCYKPKVQSGGFACSATDNPPCPSGFFCVNGLCVDTPGGGGAAGGGGGGSAGGGGGGGVVDMSLPPVDMSMPADMSTLPPDMACFPFGHTCGGDSTCCSECCHGCNAFGDCAAIG
jgi:hypothetical protein